MSYFWSCMGIGEYMAQVRSRQQVILLHCWLDCIFKPDAWNRNKNPFTNHYLPIIVRHWWPVKGQTEARWFHFENVSPAMMLFQENSNYTKIYHIIKKNWIYDIQAIFPELKFCESRVSERRYGWGSSSFPDSMHFFTKSIDTTAIPFFTAVLPLYEDNVPSELLVTR